MIIKSPQQCHQYLQARFNKTVNSRLHCCGEGLGVTQEEDIQEHVGMNHVHVYEVMSHLLE